MLAGKTKAEIALAVKLGLDSKELSLPEPGAKYYMMSKRQYLSDNDKSWHPHMMWFMPGDAATSWVRICRARLRWWPMTLKSGPLSSSYGSTYGTTARPLR